MRRIITWPNIGRLLAGSFVGLGLCRLLDGTWFRGVRTFEETSAGYVTVVVLSIVWGTTLFILLPWRVFMDRASVREMRQRVAAGEVDPERMNPVQQHLFYANYGSLPKWLYLPFVVVAVLLGSVFALALLAFFVIFVLTHVFKT